MITGVYQRGLDVRPEGGCPEQGSGRLDRSRVILGTSMYSRNLVKLPQKPSGTQQDTFIGPVTAWSAFRAKN
jgi:hypothetical protein